MLTNPFSKKHKPNKNIGAHAEEVALRYLQQQGLRLLTKNFRSRYGEIDIIMQHERTLVFIEVRCRKSHALVSAQESITPAKIKKIMKTANYYIMTQDFVPECRFDVIAMTHTDNTSGYTIDWIPNAF